MTLVHRSRAWLPFAMSLAFLFPSAATGQGIEKPRVPIRTAINELSALREEYAEAFNKKDVASLTAIYAPDATVVRGDGTVLSGKEAIQKSFEAGPWLKMSVTSDTVRVYGNTAVDVGTVRMSRPGGDTDVSHYLAVLRRGLNTWKINSVAVVPETGKANASDSTAH